MVENYQRTRVEHGGNLLENYSGRWQKDPG